MKKITVLTLSVLLQFIVPVLAFAEPVTLVDLYGDKDGFGLGIAPGGWFEMDDVVSDDDPADVATITDKLLWGDSTYSHTYDISGWSGVDSACLEIMSGGVLSTNWYDSSTKKSHALISRLYIDDEYVGDISDGHGTILNYARVDIFDLSPYFGLLDGANEIRIDTYLDSDVEKWVLDYSELTINGTNDPVPEPASILLLGAGVVGLYFRKRKIKGRL